MNGHLRTLAFASILSLGLWGCDSADQSEVVAPIAEEPTAERVWDLTDLYATPEDWRAMFDTVQEQITVLPELQDGFGDSAANLADRLEQTSSVLKEVARLYIYASLRNDENQTIAESQERLNLSMSMYSNYGSAVSWMQPAILRIGRGAVEAYIATEPRLEPFDHYLLDTLREAPHTLGDEAESVLAAAGLVFDSPNQIYELLVNADVPWPTVTLSTGEEARLDQAGYAFYRQAPNREDRKLVFDTFWSVWNEYQDSLGAILATEVNANTTVARLRHYDSFLHMQMATENIPTEIYDTLVAEVNSALPTLHRYFLLRGRMLGVEQMHYYDIYPPLVELETHFSFDETRDITLDVLSPMGETYGSHLERVANSDWIHAYPAPGKRSGAYMSGGAYDVHPYLLLNHFDDYNSLSTYAHEIGHAVHSLLANEAQPFEKADYSLFIAEMASIINEIVLEEHMIAQAETDEAKLFYLGQALESIRGTFFRQTMFAEFEQSIHETVEQGEVLTGSRMTQMYGDILKRYHGHDDGVLLIDDVYTMEWAYIPHFYYDFYVYQYATSMAGAAWFAERFLAGDTQVRDNFVEVLSAGGSDYPHEILMRAGLDMRSPEPYRATVRRMNDIMDRIEAILDNNPDA